MQNASCPPNPGLNQYEYFIDFTNPPADLYEDWSTSNYATITYNTKAKNGAEFTFAKRYDAPQLFTNFYIFFGRVDVVMQVSPGIAMISSAVLMSDDFDEIDWEMSGNDFNLAKQYPNGVVQNNYFSKGITGYYDRGQWQVCTRPQTQFHTYSFDWTPERLQWLIDGQVVRTFLAANADNKDHQYPQTPSKFQLGIWSGGDPDQNDGTRNWAGGYTDLKAAPYTMFVKSLNQQHFSVVNQVYQLSHESCLASYDCSQKHVDYFQCYSDDKFFNLNNKDISTSTTRLPFVSPTSSITTSTSGTSTRSSAGTTSSMLTHSKITIFDGILTTLATSTRTSTQTATQTATSYSDILLAPAVPVTQSLPTSTAKTTSTPKTAQTASSPSGEQANDPFETYIPPPEYIGPPTTTSSSTGSLMTTTSAATPSRTMTTGSLWPFKPSQNGLCAYRAFRVCKGSGFGDCCSRWGYCGSDEAYCADNCLQHWGSCFAPVDKKKTSKRSGGYHLERRDRAYPPGKRPNATDVV
ncbi:hypothetical protein G7054_g860 [Neopestalotiopsis clavispora]|nr:hypothetical protein G7054_g860 [Neopestalotiopsis clavispora]